jgi:uroporphyrinogen-III decarboxylase
MNNRQRFYETIHYGRPDRIPYFEEGIRSETLETWRAQGLSPDFNPQQLFPSDGREEIKLNIDPHPEFEKWPAHHKDLDLLQVHLNPNDPTRLPENWDPDRLRDHDDVLMVRVHEGLFLAMGVENGATFTSLMYQLADQPDFVRAYMHILGEFAADLAESVLKEAVFDAMVFSEPIGDNNGALISPHMYEELVLPSYEPLLNLASRYGVKTIICRTYASMKALIPSLLKWGIDTLWACEVEQSVMNYPALRREFGKDLKLIGGIDLDALREGEDAIRRAMDEIAPLVADGGFIPLADGRVRADVPYDHYVFYRELLREITS